MEQVRALCEKIRYVRARHRAQQNEEQARLKRRWARASANASASRGGEEREEDEGDSESAGEEVDEYAILESYDCDVHFFEASMLNCHGLKALHQVGGASKEEGDEIAIYSAQSERAS
jgi:hypothetical protein